jgi:hypothetical protein
MNLLKRLFGGGNTSDGESGDANALIYYVKGHKCGAVTRLRVDKRNDLSRDDADNFFVRKVVVDSKCYGQVEIELRFDASYKETSREIKGGTFTTRDAWQEWEAQQRQSNSPTSQQE